MGQKTNPVGIRLGINRSWESSWFAEKADYGKHAVDDLRIRKFIQDRIWRTKAKGGRNEAEREKFKELERNYAKLELSDIRIKRFPNRVSILVNASKPGLLIGKQGKDIEELRQALTALLGAGTQLTLNVNEIKKTDLDARAVAQVIGRAIEARMPYKRAMKQAIQRSMRSGALGIKVQVSGRLGGNDIARREYFKEGSIPLHTFGARIDHGKFDAITTFGVIGVQVWVHTPDTEENGGVLENAPALVGKRGGERRD